MVQKACPADVEIRPSEEIFFEGLWAAIDTVAREKRYLSLTQAPPREDAYAFFDNIVKNDLCQLLAVRGNEVIGWCDVLPQFGEARSHIGTLGIGLIPAARHLGIGKKLLATALQQVKLKGYRRIELTVRADNSNAKALYEYFGFVSEGLKRQAFFVDGDFYDAYAMALLF